jgi:hypothetical protein
VIAGKIIVMFYQGYALLQLLGIVLTIIVGQSLHTDNVQDGIADNLVIAGQGIATSLILQYIPYIVLRRLSMEFAHILNAKY